MGITDLIWMIAITGGTSWLLYRSLWKKRGQCHGCDGCSCEKK